MIIQYRRTAWLKLKRVTTATRNARSGIRKAATLQTDAPKDIGGEASAFSPTDLVAAALAACVLTTVAMFAERHDLDLTGMTAHVGKEMTASSAPHRPSAPHRAAAGVRVRRNAPDIGARRPYLPRSCQPAPGCGRAD